METSIFKQWYLVSRLCSIVFTSFLVIMLFTTIRSTSYAFGTCSTGGVNDAQCVNGNIQDLNFGITNAKPWFQSFCGDIRQDTGIVDKIPANPSCGGISGAYAIQTSQLLPASSNYCPTSPGIAFTGQTDPIFKQGQASANTWNWLVGGSASQNQELYKPSVVKTSYEYVSALARQSGITPVDLSGTDSSGHTYCGSGGFSDCALEPNLPHGLYSANGSNNTPVTLYLEGYTFPTAPPNQNYIFLINGDLHILGEIHIPVGDTVTFSVSGSIYVEPAVGNTSSSDLTTDLEGIYSADNSFIVNGTPSICTSGTSDNRLNIAGSVIVNAALQGGTFQNNRDLCGQDTQCPDVTFTLRPDLILNAPALIRPAQHIWQEVAP